MAQENAKIDENRKKSLLGITDDPSAELRRLLVDPTTGRLKVSAVIASGGGVDSIAKSGSTQLIGDVTLSAGAGVTLNQVGQDIEIVSTSGGAPLDATYIVQTSNATLTNEQALGSLATGLLKNTTTTGVLSIAVAGTDYQAVITGGATTILSSDLTIDRALISSGTGKVAVSAVTATELGYVSGVTSSIQTQLDGKAAALGANDNYVTDAEKIVIGNTSGTNTGDEPDSSATVKGVVELATPAEVYAGTDTVRAVTPEGNKKGTIHTMQVVLVASDTDVATGTTVQGDFRIPGNRAITVKAVGAYVDTAPTGSVATFDINENGTSILSTKITIDDGEKTSTTAATAPVISDSAIAADAVLTFDIDGVGSTTAGSGLKIWIEYILS